jgi:hypothetical protein
MERSCVITCLCGESMRLWLNDIDSTHPRVCRGCGRSWSVTHKPDLDLWVDEPRVGWQAMYR